MEFMKSLDTFRKTKEYTKEQTLSGATVSIAAGVLMFLLFISEVSFWQTTVVENHLLVDSSQADREFDIGLDISFHSLNCRELNVAAEDAKGVPYDESHVKITKTPIVNKEVGAAAVAVVGGGADGNSNTNTAAAAIVKKDGCRIAGTVRVRKVAGVIYIAAPRSLTNVDGRLAFTIAPETMASFNASHTLTRFTFGPEFPGQVCPLEGITSEPQARPASWQYHLRVVPTLYEYLYGTLIDSQQYSATDFIQQYEPEAGGYIHPGVWFKYDFAPIMVRLVETRRSLLQFLVSLCGILGGVFALSGVIDQVYYRAVESRKAK